MYADFVLQIFMCLRVENIADVLERNRNIGFRVGAVIRVGVDSILVDIDEKKCLVK